MADAIKQHSALRSPVTLILCLSALGIFLAPWYLPPSEPAMGESYTYGFNNSVAILTVGATLAALFLYMLWRGRAKGGAETDRTIAAIFDLRPDPKADGRLLLSLLCAALLYTLLIALNYWFTPSDQWGEMGYFISRLELMLIHRVPYYDFPFPYGPGMIYLPLGLYKMMHGLVSIEQAYCAILILHWILGLALFAGCVRLLFPPARRILVFWVFTALFFNPLLGINYTPLRFVLPIAALLFTHFAVMNSSRESFRGHLLVGILAFLAAFLNFELSPEMGAASTLALFVYFLALLRTPHRRFAHGAVLALLGAAAAVLPWSGVYLAVLTSFGGSMSLPIFPGLGILLFLAAIFFLLPRLAVIGITSREATGAACLAFCVLSGDLIIPALSRCDLGHVFVNGLGAILLSLALFSRWPDRRWFKGALAALFLIFAVLGEWVFLFHCSAFFKSALAAREWMHAHPMPPAPPASDGFLFSKNYPPVAGLEPLLAYGALATPLGCSADIEHYLLLHGRLRTSFYPGNCSDVRVLKQLLQQEQDLKDLHTILVPKSSLGPGISPADFFPEDYRFLRNQLLFPVRLVPRHLPFNPSVLLAAQISRQFSVIGEFRDNFIMVNSAKENR